MRMKERVVRVWPFSNSTHNWKITPSAQVGSDSVTSFPLGVRWLSILNRPHHRLSIPETQYDYEVTHVSDLRVRSGDCRSFQQSAAAR